MIIILLIDFNFLAKLDHSSLGRCLCHAALYIPLSAVVGAIAVTIWSYWVENMNTRPTDWGTAFLYGFISVIELALVIGCVCLLWRLFGGMKEYFRGKKVRFIVDPIPDPPPEL